MNQEQKSVEEWHRIFGVRVNKTPTIVDPATAQLRLRLISEEFGELRRAVEQEDLVKIADGLADLLYVIYGTAVSYGLDLEPIFEEVHASNMSKGNPRVVKREDGKILKGENWKPPALEPIIQEQLG